MPALQRILAETGVPTARRQGGRVGVPREPAPTLLPLGATGGTGAAIADLGATVAVVAGRATEQTARLAEIERKRQENLAQLNRQEADLFYSRGLEEFRETRRLDPAFTVTDEPEVLEAFGTQLAQQLSETFQLTPFEQEAFQVSAGRTLNVALKQSREARLVAQVERNELVGRERIAHHSRGMLRTTDPLARSLHEVGLRNAVDDLVASGLLSPKEGQALFEEKVQEVLEQEGEIAIEGRIILGQGAAVIQELRGRVVAASRNEEYTDPTRTPEFDAFPRDQITAMLDFAQQLVSEELTRKEAEEDGNAKELAELQNTLASSYRTELSVPGLTLPQLETLRRRVDISRGRRDLNEGDHTDLLSDIRALRTGVTTGPQVNNPDVLREAALLINLADSPEDYDTARVFVVDNAHARRLTGGTVGTLLGRIDTRRDKNNYSNLDSFREGVALLKGRAFPPGIVAQALDKITNANAIRLNTAIQRYHIRMEAIQNAPGGGRSAVDESAREEAIKLREIYFPLAQVEDRPPLFNQNLAKFEKAIRRMDASGDVKLDLIQQYRALPPFVEPPKPSLPRTP